MKRFLCLLAAVVLIFSSTGIITATAAEKTKFPYKQGDSGTNVTKLLDRLYTLQYLNADDIKSGQYTKDVTTAVKTFQKKNKLKQTGKVDESTWEKMFSDEAVNAYGLVWNEINDYTATNNYLLLGDEQFYVGADGNVILIILDTYSNTFFNSLARSLKGYSEGL